MKLSPSSVLNIPFDKYEKDFSFIINDVEYRTSRFQADLLCPKISKLHSIDPPINQIAIKVCNQGNFQFILNLLQFDEIEIPEIEKPFIAEIVNHLDNQYITFEKMLTHFQPVNVLDDGKIHESHLFFHIFTKRKLNLFQKTFVKLLRIQFLKTNCLIYHMIPCLKF